MKEVTEILKSMEYLGRFFAIGRNPDGLDIVVYGITGRSPSSQARRLILDKQPSQGSSAGLVIKVEPTDSQILASGNPDLRYF